MHGGEVDIRREREAVEVEEGFGGALGEVEDGRVRGMGDGRVVLDAVAAEDDFA